MKVPLTVRTQQKFWAWAQLARIRANLKCDWYKLKKDNINRNTDIVILNKPNATIQYDYDRKAIKPFA